MILWKGASFSTHNLLMTHHISMFSKSTRHEAVPACVPACDGLAAVSVDRDRVAGCLEWPPLLALEAFCSHNTQAVSRSCREAARRLLRKKMPKAKWIGDEWWRMMGLVTLLHGLIPRQLKTLSPILFTQHASLQMIS